MASRKPKVTGCQITTAGVTQDGKYSLAISELDGEPCLCIHRCAVKGGLHYSTMDDRSLVTGIGKNTVLRAAQILSSPAWSDNNPKKGTEQWEGEGMFR